MRLWIDDLRPAPEGWVWVTTSRLAIVSLETLLSAELVDRLEVISYDHDLGGDDTSRRVILWQCENNVWPHKAQIHSANPVGREWMQGMLARYGNLRATMVHYKES